MSGRNLQSSSRGRLFDSNYPPGTSGRSRDTGKYPEIRQRGYYSDVVAEQAENSLNVSGFT